MTEKLPFKKAEKVTKRAKILVTANAGVGKTVFALQFPAPCVIDMEHGTDLYGHKYDFEVKHTQDIKEVDAIVQTLLTTTHPYKTLVIDSLTVYAEELQEQIAAKNKGEMGPKEWGMLSSGIAKLCRMLTLLDMNIIVTTGEKNLYADGEFMKKIGVVYDAPRKLNRHFDTVVRFWVDTDKSTGKISRWATCEGTDHLKNRGDLLPSGIFPLEYEVFKKAYGDVIEGESIPVEFLNEEQSKKIDELVILLNLGQDQIGRALAKVDVKNKNELTKGKATELIEILETGYEKQKTKLAKKEEADNANL